MKNWIRKMISVLAVCAMVIGLGVPVRTQAAEADTDTYVQQLIAYYRDDQENAETDIERVLSEMEAVDAQQAEAWRQIMDYWSYVNTDMPVNLNVAPDGLPQDDSLCIVILGFALNSDGTMKDELIGRLETGLASAEKYPNAYVVVTGGGTASGNPDVTEGGLMGEWLLEHGLSEDRLIIEDQAPDTVGNAENTYRILSEEYPSVKNLVMVTSDYHVPRGSILFCSKCLLSAYESGGELLQVIANAGYETGSQGYESISLQASGVASVAGVSVSSERLPLSQLTGLTVSQDQMYEAGNELQLSVTAHYDTDFSRAVSTYTIEGFDPAQGSDQEITVSYTENDITISAQFSLSEKSQSYASAAYLEKRIEEIEQTDLSAYTASSVNALQEALTQAKEIAAQADADAEQIQQAYDALNEAFDALIKRVNIAYYMETEANCNDTDAYKINDGVIDTSNYWQSVENGQNVASADAQITIDLDGLYDVDSIVVYPYWGGQRIYKYELYGSTDGEEWFKIGEHDSDEYVTSAGISHEIDAQVAYVRLNGLETHVEGRDDINNIHIVEMEVYGEEADNLAYGKPVTSSGTDTSAGSSAGSSDAQIVDGDRTTYWDGGVYADEPWVCVDLGEIYSLDRLNIITYWARNDRYYYYDLYTSVDGENFTLLYAKDEGTQLSTIHGEDVTVDGTVHARYVRLVGKYDSANPSFHLNELRVYGQSDETWNDVRSALADALQRSEALDLSQYTARSVQEVQEQMNAAQLLLEDGTVSTAQLTTMESQLSDAVSALQYKASDPAMSALQELVNKANAMASEEEILNAAINAAQSLLDDPDNASANAVVSALLDLSEAMQALNTDESADALREDVQATIDFINENILNDTEGLRPAKVQALIDAVAAAQDAVDDPEADADQLKAANEAMTKAAQELWEIVTKAELEALIESANGYLDGNYTEESLEALQTAITAAQAVANNDDATTSEVTAAITDLANAIAALESITLDTSALAHEIELVTEMVANIDDYVPSTVEGLADKLADAQNVLTDATTQEEIDAATETLREARLNARTKADKSALEALIAEVSAMDLRMYTQTSANALRAALIDAQQTVADEEATQEEVDDAIDTLNVALNALTEENAATQSSQQNDTGINGGMSGMFGLLLISAGAVILPQIKKKHGLRG